MSSSKYGVHMITSGKYRAKGETNRTTQKRQLFSEYLPFSSETSFDWKLDSTPTERLGPLGSIPDVHSLPASSLGYMEDLGSPDCSLMTCGSIAMFKSFNAVAYFEMVHSPMS